MSPKPLPKGNHGRKPPAPPHHSSRRDGKGCPLELVTTVPVVIVMLLVKAAWRRVRR